MVTVREMAAADAEAVLAIYADGIATGHATFQATAPNWATWDAGHLPSPRLVAVERTPLGFAALSPTSARPVYRGVAECSIYVASAASGQGFGHALMTRLIERSEAEGIWTLQAGIFPENAASLALHEAAGFRRIGVRERVGRMSHGPAAGQWRDVVLLERRSTVVGCD